ncbi:25170_t:CDS:1, partial [Dentiscutata erythropus]
MTELLNEELPSIPLLEYVTNILPSTYNYIISDFHQLPDFVTAEEFIIHQFELNLFINANDVDRARQ